MKLVFLGFLLTVTFMWGEVHGLSPNEVLVIVNSANEESLEIGGYYCDKRGVPVENIVRLDLGRTLIDTISRADYERQIEKPLLDVLNDEKFSGKIKCLLTIYGVPFRIAKKPVSKSDGKVLDVLAERLEYAKRQIVSTVNSLEAERMVPVSETSSLNDVLSKSESAMEDIFKRTVSAGGAFQKENYFEGYIKIYGKSSAVKKSKLCSGYSVSLSFADKLSINSARRFFDKAERQRWDAERKLREGYYERLEKHAGLRGLSLRLRADMAQIKGSDTDAALDSELSLLRFLPYDLYRWKKNELHESFLWFGVKTLMVSRLDGPGAEIAKSLVDKALAAQSRGQLKGNVCIDWGYSKAKSGRGLYGEYDKSLERTAELFRTRTSLNVKTESTGELFSAGSCPDTAVYCGWYSLEKYADAFDFVDGAVGYHIASFEAINLRDPQSRQWCPAMLMDGIGACVGAVGEPYLSAFPKPDEFYAELLKGKTLVEAYYRTNPYNSWRMLLIGDPLYVPFGKGG